MGKPPSSYLFGWPFTSSSRMARTTAAKFTGGFADLRIASDLNWSRTPMRKKPARRPVMSNSEQHPGILDWRNVPEEEFFLYARAFRAAAKKMALALELDPGPFTKFAACPVVFMYRHALELHLKALILGDGSNFLRQTRPAVGL